MVMRNNCKTIVSLITSFVLSSNRKLNVSKADEISADSQTHQLGKDFRLIEHKQAQRVLCFRILTCCSGYNMGCEGDASLAGAFCQQQAASTLMTWGAARCGDTNPAFRLEYPRRVHPHE
jgi:hypothetical protein